QVVAGPDPRDSTCSPRAVPDLVAACAAGATGLTVGIPGEYFPDDLDPSVDAACRAALDALEEAGARLREVSLPHTEHAIPTYYVLAPAEASSNLARFDGVRYGARAPGSRTTREVYEATRSRGFGAEVKRRILLGTYVLSAGYYEAYYGRAQAVRRRIADDFRRVFADGVDVIFTPTAPGVAFGLGERFEDPYAMYLSDVFTVTANLAGLPALSVPVGTAGGLPVGGQLLGPRWGEEAILRAAGAVEAALGTGPTPAPAGEAVPGEGP
ncbi:MAG: Asp-tRNA(Asn)/Glu-tRNA(Gln) amidotransferase GatCAB subunit A, partial [Gemmatimonadetes bacterium]|nr:Asp-tRNA(Asn)/Glu-tRNA(Gln) amidotransferase GatCAB subunit A [Gemmatimonadota bacterium]NIR77384.1 Asp-tRNA(Asn)/Glu-tRNA(Gln) amidotransferase GatCAB subunit A [Gemmatimonadota bacterium]NIT85894.1 Asp-tRNA(Asn)/Glu-tRNA(Gln) amidotransferase GatCAB subunit A [Gemmatimonadota bacterium]NIU29720.1 Asp-tRNA(Asn)/Glu-tRNA(Gln) amidotransferase GatCAB subunit A [Gemmatimonadota bacterium]NIU34762.1 Asp-tRNA(Asn)/Glu-tRNA(Gln) amidotransferase GatCAB subunit A [Gemmatimonadota bacterium]